VKLILEAEKRGWRAGETVTVSLLVHNDGFEPAVLDRRLLIGPNLMPASGEAPPPISVEPAFADEERNEIYLNPWTIYGRRRSFPVRPADHLVFYGYLLRRPSIALLPNGPADPDTLLAEAEPLVLTVE